MNNVIYITCGNPSLEITKDNILKNQSADMMILSIPFSDPVAEEPKLQKANLIALKNGTTTDKIFDMLKEIKSKNNVSLIFRTYANVIFSYGIERFVKKCSEVDIKGIMIPDVPYEEREEFEYYCNMYNVVLVSTLSTRSKERIKEILSKAKDFIYIQAGPNECIKETLNIVKQYSSLPYITDQQFKYLNLNLF